MIKAVLFDLDNTLTDFMRFKRLSTEAAVDAMLDAGLHIKRDEALARLYAIYDQKGYEYSLVFQKLLKEVIGEVDHCILAHAIVAYRQVRLGFLHPYPGTKRTLIRLKKMGLKLAIVTDAPKLKAWVRIATMQLEDFFDDFVTFDDTKKYKPHNAPFKLSLTNIGIKPEHAMMVGDNPGRDLLGAKRMKMKACFAEYGYEGEPDTSSWDYRISDISELPELIKLMK